jgi:hypothetical protein
MDMLCCARPRSLERGRRQLIAGRRRIGLPESNVPSSFLPGMIDIRPCVEIVPTGQLPLSESAIPYKGFYADADFEH